MPFTGEDMCTTQEILNDGLILTPETHLKFLSLKKKHMYDNYNIGIGTNKNVLTSTTFTQAVIFVARLQIYDISCELQMDTLQPP